MGTVHEGVGRVSGAQRVYWSIRKWGRDNNKWLPSLGVKEKREEKVLPCLGELEAMEV